MKRRRPAPRRARAKRRKTMRRRMRKRNGSMMMKRKFYLNSWSPNTATTAGFWRYQTFQFQDMPSSGEIGALFDQVRINRIKVEYMPRYDSFDGANTTDTTLPGLTNQWGTNVHVILDQDSTVTPSGVYGTSFNAFCENGNVRTYQGNRKITVFYTPKVNMNVQGASVKRARAPYVSTQDNTPIYYGYHMYIQDSNFTATGLAGQVYDVFVTYYMTCKNTR